MSSRGARHVPWLAAITLLAAASGGGEAAALAAETAIPAAPTQFATDGAGFLSEAARLELDGRLRAYETSSGHQVLLWIGRTTGDAPIEDWAVRAFSAWRVGRKGLDDGVVLFIMADDRKLRIEVGYGVEDRLTDARAATIIREQITPRLRQGDRDGAARSGIAAILGALGDAGADVAPVSQHELPPKLGWGGLVGLTLLGLLVIWFLATHPTLAILFLTQMASSRGMRRGGGGGWGGFGGSGGGFSGGGFSGGGGRSGGGGATGSW